MLSTNGNASFAALVYQDPPTRTDIPIAYVVGFDAGDRITGINLGSESAFSGLQGTNVFRIDGKYALLVLAGMA